MGQKFRGGIVLSNKKGEALQTYPTVMVLPRTKFSPEETRQVAAMHQGSVIEELMSSVELVEQRAVPAVQESEPMRGYVNYLYEFTPAQDQIEVR